MISTIAFLAEEFAEWGAQLPANPLLINLLREGANAAARDSHSAAVEIPQLYRYGVLAQGDCLFASILTVVDTKFRQIPRYREQVAYIANFRLHELKKRYRTLADHERIFGYDAEYDHPMEVNIEAKESVAAAAKQRHAPTFFSVYSATFSKPATTCDAQAFCILAMMYDIGIFLVESHGARGDRPSFSVTSFLGPGREANPSSHLFPKNVCFVQNHRRKPGHFEPMCGENSQFLFSTETPWVRCIWTALFTEKFGGIRNAQLQVRHEHLSASCKRFATIMIFSLWISYRR